MTLVESITRGLHRLPNAKLVEVARFIGELGSQVSARQRLALDESYGCIDDEQGETFEGVVLKEEVTKK